MDKQVLKNLISEDLTQREIAKKHSCSQATVKHWLKKYNLKTNGSKGAKSKPFCCMYCGDKNPVNSFSLNKKKCKLHNSLCVNCEKKRNSLRLREIKKSFVEYKGGKCEICGYNKCIASLQFHHLDPKSKSANWDSIKNNLLENAKDELDKCQMLCANCHFELHFNNYRPIA